MWWYQHRVLIKILASANLTKRLCEIFFLGFIPIHHLKISFFVFGLQKQPCKSHSSPESSENTFALHNSSVISSLLWTPSHIFSSLERHIYFNMCKATGMNPASSMYIRLVGIYVEVYINKYWNGWMISLFSTFNTVREITKHKGK